MMHDVLALQWWRGKLFETFDRMKIGSALKYSAKPEEASLQVVPEVRPGFLGHCREQRK